VRASIERQLLLFDLFRQFPYRYHRQVEIFFFDASAIPAFALRDNRESSVTYHTQAWVSEASFRSEHVSEIHGLPPIHKDPFDRALIAQAMAENLTVATDVEIPKYTSERFRTLH
jgi:hypothetical protein